MEELKIKWLNKDNTYKILIDSISISQKSWTDSTEYKIKFDELGFDVIKEKSKKLLWVSPLFLVLSSFQIYLIIDNLNNNGHYIDLGFKVLGFLGFFGGFIHCIFSKFETVYCTGGKYVLTLDASKPNTEKVYLFVNKIHEAMKKFYKEKYGKIDSVFDKSDSQNNFLWLKSNKIITEIEYNNLIEELNLKYLL